MRTSIILMLFAALISFNLSACSSISGNVVPKSGPAMEKVYDSMGDQNVDNIDNSNKLNSKQNIKLFRAKQFAVQNSEYKNYRTLERLHKIPNPELRMYIYPHLAGRDQIPVPGYTTEFNVYERDYYAL